jgi:prepilin-type N-terminal cleavage/methylation domain-containing protein
MRSRSAAGFTLVEVLVALVLLAWGALALVAGSAAAVRAVAAAEAQDRATTAARDRLEQLAARECSSIQPGTSVDSSLALRERWSVAAGHNGLRLLTDSADYLHHRAGRPVVLHRLVVC